MKDEIMQLKLGCAKVKDEIMQLKLGFAKVE
jgi:hypothetical protein